MAKIKITSDSANKMIRDLERQAGILSAKEAKGTTFISTMEDKENDRPNFSLVENLYSMNRVQNKIAVLRNAIHSFNIDYVLENGMTIDMALLTLKYLQEIKLKFGSYMEMVDGKRRGNSSITSKAEYTFLNFDMKYVEETYGNVCERIVQLQSLINKANVVVEFEVDIPE